MEKRNPSGPAEELRAAAKVLRETASNATPGPRKVGRIAGIGHCVSSPDLKFCVAVEPGWVSKGDVAWIGLASPELAEPLADLLDATADEYEREKCDDPRGVCNRCEFDPSVLPALTFAAEILGISSDGSEAGR